MEFQWSAEVQERSARARRLVDERLIPLERRLFEGQAREVEAEVRALKPEVQEMGLWGPTLPQELGGLGLPLMEVAALFEALGRSPLGNLACHAQAPDAGNLEILIEHATADQRARWLEPLARGELRSCFAMTEPGRAGSNPTWLETRAVREGDDYVLSGRKWFTSSADGAAFAIVMAVTNPEAERPHERASQIIVPMDAPGLTRLRNIPIAGDAGGGYFSHAELSFDEVRVPVSNRLGAEGAGFRIAQERLGPGRIHHCMRWIGICERALELLVGRAASRELSPGRPLGDKQVVRAWIADSRMEIDAARLLVLKAAEAITLRGAKAARGEISAIKVFTAGVLQRVLDRAVQAHGALGLTSETPLAFWFAHERGARIYDGADEVHRDVVARSELSRFHAQPSSAPSSSTRRSTSSGS